MRPAGAATCCSRWTYAWWRGWDLNPRPPGYQPDRRRFLNFVRNKQLRHKPLATLALRLQHTQHMQRMHCMLSILQGTIWGTVLQRVNGFRVGNGQSPRLGRRTVRRGAASQASPHPRKPLPGDAVTPSEPRTPQRSTQNGELLPKGQVPGGQAGPDGVFGGDRRRARSLHRHTGAVDDMDISPGGW